MPFSLPLRVPRREPHDPYRLASVGLGCSPFARRYLGNRGCFLFLRVLRCFSSPGWLLAGYGFTSGWQVVPAGLPHSEIFRSQPVSGSLKLFAAVHVLLRLSSPGHPPCALSSLTVSLRHASIYLAHLPSQSSSREHLRGVSVSVASFWTLFVTCLSRTRGCSASDKDRLDQWS